MNALRIPHSSDAQLEKRKGDSRMNPINSTPSLKRKRGISVGEVRFPNPSSSSFFFHPTNKSSRGVGKKYLKNPRERSVLGSLPVFTWDDPQLHSPVPSL